MAKPTKTQWAYGDSSYRVQPSSGKMNVGWLSAEKPPFQYFNWLHYNYNLWEDFFEAKTETISPTMLQSSGTATWNGSALALSAILNISFRVTTTEQINQLPLATYTFNDGEVLVFRKDKTNPSPVSLASGTYASLGNGQYAIISEASLTANAHEFEVVLFRRRGTNLECPINGSIWATGETITFGRSAGIPSYVSDHGALSGLADDDHPQYALIASSETISGTWNYTTLPTASSNPSSSTQLARKAYVDSAITAAVVTDHGALTGLSDDDHPQYTQNLSNETISGNWLFNGIPSTSVDPSSSNHITRKSYVDGRTALKVAAAGDIVDYGGTTAGSGTRAVGSTANLTNVASIVYDLTNDWYEITYTSAIAAGSIVMVTPTPTLAGYAPGDYGVLSRSTTGFTLSSRTGGSSSANDFSFIVYTP